MAVRYITRNIDAQNKAILHFGELFMVVLPYLKKPVSAEHISKKIRIKPSKIRAVLNKLFNHNLIDYKRCFDDDTGKYTYVWTLKQAKLKQFLRDYQFDVPSSADSESQRSDFACTGCSENYSFDAAADYSFKCYKCGSFIDARS